MKKIYLHAVNGFAEIKSRIRNVLSGEEGMGTVEVILIILVLIGLVIIFKNQLTSLVQTIFRNNKSGRQYIAGKGKAVRKGYITVYLSLVTGILLSLLLTIIEGVRMHTIRTQTECVMDMAMDSALAEYHREMLEQYELFFIDMSYGGTSPAFSNTEEHIRNYMNMNFRPYELFDIPVGKDLTGLSADGVDLQQAAIASDEKGAVLKKQAITYMKDKWGLGFLEQAAVNAGLIQTGGFLGTDVELRRNETEKQVKEAILNKEKQEAEDWEGKNVELPSDVVNEARGEGILKLAVENSASLSRESIPKAALYTGRSNKMEGTGLPSGVEPPSGVSDTCLFLKYVMDKCGYYNQIKDGSSFSYQVEYILQGKGNDLDNLRGMANQILLVREAANVAYLFSDGQKNQRPEELHC